MSLPTQTSIFFKRPLGHKPLQKTLSNGSQWAGRLMPKEGFESVTSMAPQYQSTRNAYLSNRYQHPPVEHERREKITINVSGERYQTYVDTLNQFPDTLLGNSIKREQFYDDVEDEYFFDRDRSAFNAILYFYQSNGHLYCPLTVPMTILVTEAKFFELGNDALKQVLDLTSEDDKTVMPKNKWQKKIWCLFEYPETSRAAHVLTLFSVLMIVFSIIILCIETLPFSKYHRKGSAATIPQASLNKFFLNQTLYHNTTMNFTGSIHSDSSGKFIEKLQCSCKCYSSSNSNNKHIKTSASISTDFQKINWHTVFTTCEAIFVAWFTFEFIVRFATSPNKIEFMKGYLNIIDIISILPFYVTTALDRHEELGLENIRIVRLVRVFRIFKLSRHSKGLQILGHTLMASIRELCLLVFFLAIGVILFSSAVYYLEGDNFTSIPDAFWWAIITMCTVGYGDKVPKTFWGKIVGGACSVCGVLSIALPVPVIVSNFDYFYNREKTKKIHEEYLEETPAKTLERRPFEPKATKGSPLLKRNGSNKSPVDTRNDEIQRQTTLKGLEKRNRKLSQKLSEVSLHSSPHRKNGNVCHDRESYM